MCLNYTNTSFFSSLTVALRVFQTQRVNAAQSQLEESTNRVSSFKETEAQLSILKNRLGTIGKLTETPSKQRQMYNLVTELLPPQMVLNSVTVDSTGSVSLSLIAANIDAVENLTDSLLDTEKNEGLINKVEVENLTRSRDGIFRVGLKVTTN